MNTLRRLSASALAISALACSSPPLVIDDAAIVAIDMGSPEDAFVMSPPDAASDPDAPECPVLAMGHYAIDTTMFTYDGPDCTPMSSIDLQFHPVSFDVDASGMVTACQCDTATDTCTVSTLQPPHLPDCSVTMDCHGAMDWIAFVGPMRAEMRMRRLASGFGTCYATGPYLPR